MTGRCEEPVPAPSMSRRDVEAAGLRAAPDAEAYLRAHSGLPGPRGNLELIDVASGALERSDLVRWAALDPDAAPENTPGVFLVCVGVVGLGRLVARGDRTVLPGLRRSASDLRWRVREAVAMALQAWGDVEPDAMVDEAERWVDGSFLEGRAAMAALCEPRLLRDRRTIERTIAVLDRLTTSIRDSVDRKDAGLRVLRLALGYGWSVAATADMAIGVPAMERWLTDPDRDVRWIVRENLGKARLARLAPDWVAHAMEVARGEARLAGDPGSAQTG